MRNELDILSPAYKKQIDEACKSLPELGLKNFAMYLCFNDGGSFHISNDYSIRPDCHNWHLKEGVIDSLALTHAPQQDYYLFDKKKEEVQQLHSERLYRPEPIFNLIRSHSECFFVFSASGDFPKEPIQLFYEKTVKKFEGFCIQFVDAVAELIINYNPDYRFSFVLTNKHLRDAVIRQGYDTEISLSLREQECLWYAVQGKSAKEVGRILCLSPLTVEQYLKGIRKRFDGRKLPEIMLECIHRGIIGKVGCFNKQRHSATPVYQPTFIN